jgi:hypothetical protein
VQKDILEGKKESSVITHKMSHDIMEIVDTVLKIINKKK